MTIRLVLSQAVQVDCIYPGFDFARAERHNSLAPLLDGPFVVTLFNFYGQL
jgi:hypothetical protein